MNPANASLLSKAVVISVIWVGIACIACLTPRPLVELGVMATIATGLVSRNF